MNQAKATGVGEWAQYSLNCVDGCSHDCRYCYAKGMAARFKRISPEHWKDEKPKVTPGRMRKRNGRIMFPSSHDITPATLGHCVEKLGVILGAGNSVLIVSKPHVECIERVCEEFADFKNQMLFRFTIGSASDETLRFWEPGAPTFKERQQALKLAHKKGFACSVSCEPMLDDRIDRVIESVEPFVTDSIWLGKANRLKQNLAANKEVSPEVLERADQLIAWQSDDRIKELHNRYRKNPKIKFKDSIKKVVGLESTEIGGDR